MNSTLHGLNKTCETNTSHLRRIVWIMLLFSAIAGYLFLMTTSILKYYRFDTNTKITETTVKQLDFPSVSICQQNQFAQSLVQNDPQLRYWVEYLELNPLDTLSLEDIDNATSVLRNYPQYQAFTRISSSFLRKCQFDGSPFECADYFTIAMSELSMCATLMSGSVRDRFGPWITETPGYSFGLGKFLALKLYFILHPATLISRI